mgnify:CR=1 FL=1
MDGKLFQIDVSDVSVASPTHPCVFKTLAALAGQGVLPDGMLYALDGDGKLIPYDRAGVAPANALKGVLSKSIDTATDDAAIGIIHGTVNTEKLVHGAAGDAVTAADLAALEAIMIYPQ